MTINTRIISAVYVLIRADYCVILGSGAL